MQTSLVARQTRDVIAVESCWFRRALRMPVLVGCPYRLTMRMTAELVSVDTFNRYIPAGLSVRLIAFAFS